MGVIAYELLASQHPFAGKRSAQAMIVAHIVEAPPPFASTRTDLPQSLGALVMRCLAKDPSERPADGRALSDLLDTIAVAGFVTPRESPVTADVKRGAQAPRSIAVLPMVNTSGDPENEHFSDGLTDELIGALSAVESLRVTGRTSSFALKGKGLGVADVARALGVESVLEGSVRKVGARLKARVQLVNADGNVLWSEVFDRIKPAEMRRAESRTCEKLSTSRRSSPSRGSSSSTA